MFAKSITDSDEFLKLPLKSQLLYFHLCMHADDDGFVGNPTSIQRMVGVTAKSMEPLLNAKYVIPFNSGVCVIKHWRIHNYIQSDRYRETIYLSEKRAITLGEGKEYIEIDGKCIQDVSTMDTECTPRLGKDRLGEDSIDQERVRGAMDTAATPPTPTPRRRFVPPTLEEVTAYVKERESKVDPQGFIDFYSSKGWMVGRSPMKDWKAACRGAESWERWERGPSKAPHSAKDYDEGGPDFLGR